MVGQSTIHLGGFFDWTEIVTEAVGFLTIFHSFGDFKFTLKDYENMLTRISFFEHYLVSMVCGFGHIVSEA